MLAEVICDDSLSALKKMDDESVHCVVTSPPYWHLANYGFEGQIGVEDTPEEYVDRLAEVFDEVKRVLRKDGLLFLNIGDTYYGSGGSGGDFQKGGLRETHKPYRQPRRRHAYLKPGDLVGVPWKLAMELQRRGWYLRADCIWNKTQPYPESVLSRPRKGHEYVFMLSKSSSSRYFYDATAIAQQGKNVTTNWIGPSSKKRGKTHPAPMPEHIVVKSILAGTSNGGVCVTCKKPYQRMGPRWFHLQKHVQKWKADCKCENNTPIAATVLDPFCGTSTVGLIAIENLRSYVGIDGNADYCNMSRFDIGVKRRKHLPQDITRGIMVCLGMEIKER
jgi:DNA modification methylase